MADPMKTTIQEALDHINAWIAQGEKDKAIKGLEEVLGFEPGNTQAASMLAGLKGGSASGAPAQTPSAAPIAPAPVVPPVVPAKLDIELNATMAPATPPVASTAVPATPVPPQPMTPPPAPPALKPVSTITPPPANKPNEQEAAINKVQNLSNNVKWMIFAGALIFAIIGGYLFYKNFLGASEPLVNDIQAQVEQQDVNTIAPEPVITTDDTLTPIDDTPLSDAPAVDTATDTTVDISPSSDAPASDAPNEKVKRR